MDKISLKKFLYDSNAAGYAGGDSKEWIKNDDGSTTIPYVKGMWRSDDTYYGGEPYGGRIIVFYEDKPCWMMLYYGWVHEGVDHDVVYKVLQKALMKMPVESPYRGPKMFEADDYVYHNGWKGDVEQFSGKESISTQGNMIYTASYLGGYVDIRR